jgi:hypothetical protein
MRPIFMKGPVTAEVHLGLNAATRNCAMLRDRGLEPACLMLERSGTRSCQGSDVLRTTSRSLRLIVIERAASTSSAKERKILPPSSKKFLKSNSLREAPVIGVTAGGVFPTPA